MPGKKYIKRLKRMIRVCGLILFMIFAVAGMSISGAMPTLTKDKKLFTDKESKIQTIEENKSESGKEELKL